MQLCEEKKTLADRAEKLERDLKEAVQGQLAPVRHKIDADTPVEKMISLLTSMIKVYGILDRLLILSDVLGGGTSLVCC